MKKLLLLAVSALLISSGAFAQKKWTNLITNGDAESVQDPKTSNFWAHDWRQGVEFEEETNQFYSDAGQFNGFAEIVEDPANPSNHCYRVIVRSQAEAEAAGNMISADGGMAGWDSQFFIATPEPLPSGKEFRITMKIKADKNAKSGTQAHGFPGEYHFYQMIGDMNFTTEWVTFEQEGTISDSQAYGDNNYPGFQSIAFNLSDFKDGYTVYFDDIKFEVRDPKEINPDDESTMINFLRNGIYTEDKFGNFYTFTGRDGLTGVDGHARIVNDPLDGQPALNVTTIYYNDVDRQPVYDEDDDGNPLLDDNGNPVQALDPITGELMWNDIRIRTVKDPETGEVVVTNREDNDSKILDWSSQFFITVSHKFVSNEPIHLRMLARATKPISLDTQAHNMPGDYVYWNMLGSLELDEQWKEFDLGSAEDPRTVPSEDKGCQTIAFNCNKYQDEPVEIYFRIEELSFNKSMITTNERILGSSSVTLPVAAAKDGETTATIDLSEAVKVLGIDDFDGFLANDPARIKSIDAETEDEIFNEVQMTVGASVDQNGNFTEDDTNVIYLLQDDDNTKDGVLSLNITNAGIEIEKGKTIETKIALENDFWLYLYNVTFMDNDEYTDINGVESNSTVNNAIYDLTGRKVEKASKGIYIIGNKKVLVK